MSLDLALFLVAVLLVAALAWLLLAGDREGEMVDEPSTLDVQNHRGDDE